jgi:hypothetical protein
MLFRAENKKREKRKKRKRKKTLEDEHAEESAALSRALLNAHKQEQKMRNGIFPNPEKKNSVACHAPKLKP